MDFVRLRVIYSDPLENRLVLELKIIFSNSDGIYSRFSETDLFKWLVCPNYSVVVTAVQTSHRKWLVCQDAI